MAGSLGFQRTWDWTKRVGPALAAIIDNRVETGNSPPSPGLPWWRYHVRMLIGSVEENRMPSMVRLNMAQYNIIQDNANIAIRYNVIQYKITDLSLTIDFTEGRDF
jgi:hypothetical protein